MKEVFVILVDKKKLVKVLKAIDESKMTFYDVDETSVMGVDMIRVFVKGTQKHFNKLMKKNKKLFPNGRLF